MKFFTKEVKIALMAIVAIILLFIGINFLKGVNVFNATNTYYVRFHDVHGLAVSNPVYANGYAVGTVRSIDYDYNSVDNVVVTIELNDEMRVPVGTRAELEEELMGGVKMSLVLGPNPTQNLAIGDTITGAMHQGALDRVQAMLPALEQLLPKLDSILANVNRLTADPALAQTLRNTAELTGNLNEVSMQLKSVMANDVPALLGKANRVASNVETLSNGLARVDVDGTMQRVDTTLRNVNVLTNNLCTTTNMLNTKLNSRDNTLGLFLNDRGAYDHLNSTLRHADSLMIDLKAHPKRYVHFSVFGKKDK